MMSRVHKYRAYDKKEKVMVEVDELRYFPEDNDKLQLENIWFTFPNSLTRQLRKLEDIELMEFTGLLDKNGVEIYEGDIIKIESIVYYSDSSKKVYRNGKVIWNQNKSRFEVFLSKKHYNTFIWAVNEQSEVIGNIFENTEYLEE